MSTENDGLAVACFQVYYGITTYTSTPNITLCMPIYESYKPVFRDSSVSIELTQYLSIRPEMSTASAFSSVGKHDTPFVESRNVVILACDN